MMQTRTLGPFTVNAIGLGCMSMSHAYGTPDPVEAERTLAAALDIGYNFLDTAALYGFGKNEELLGGLLKHRRKEFVLASKCGIWKGVDGKREINGTPAKIREVAEGALKRLQTDTIDLYYLHRRDFNVPIEDSVGEMARLVEEGKVRTLGLSEVSAATLRKAHAVHPITALQTEYSLCSRNAEIAVLDTCKQLGIAFVAFSPLGRAFLTGKLTDYKKIADEAGCSMAQLALAWVLAKGAHIIPIPGTRHLAYAQENFGAINVQLTADQVARLDALINTNTVAGPRYNAVVQTEIDTEQFS